MQNKSMASHLSLFLFYVVSTASFMTSPTYGSKPIYRANRFNKTAFPDNFIFGAASSAYQVEGAAGPLYGKGPSIWDIFTKKHPEKIWDHSTGEVADDFYHRYKSDIRLMKKIGLDTFRFSISWSRILPRGKISSGMNPIAVQFYNNLINELLANGIIPFVTIFHWDVPQALEDEYGGLLSLKFVNDYRDYANICFKLFGDRVKHWTTLNEPLSVSLFGYTTGTFAPGRCSNYTGNCTAGNSATEPYIVAHHFLLGHAFTVKLYREKYQAYQNGEIGITLVSHWFFPKVDTPTNRKAAIRVLDFWLGWFANPITYGDYPATMKRILANRLPKFSEEESKMLKGSYDFLGLNYYTANYVENNAVINSVNLSYTNDHHSTLSIKNGVPIGTPTDLNWLFVYPKGLRELLVYTKKTYNNPTIYITENGIADLNNALVPIKDALKDAFRIRHLSSHLTYLAQAIKEGVKVKGYFTWSFMDDFEWDAGYTIRFGLTYIDYENGLKRYLKYSAYWLKNFLRK